MSFRKIAKKWKKANEQITEATALRAAAARVLAQDLGRAKKLLDSQQYEVLLEEVRYDYDS